MKRKKLEEYKEITQIIRKTKKNLKELSKTVAFEEPILWMIYNNKRVKYYEGVKSGKYEFEKSNGEPSSIEIDPQFLLTFPIGKDIFRGYICHEDVPFPLPQKPLIYAEQWNASIQKIMNDKATYKTDTFSDKGEMFLRIGKGIAIIIASILGLKIIGGLVGVDIALPFLGGEEEVIKQVTNNVTTTVFQ